MYLYLALGLSMCRPADLPTCQSISHFAYTYIGLPYIYHQPSLSADLPSHLLFYILYISIFNTLPFYLPTCLPADPPLMLNIIYMHKGYSIFSPYIYILPQSCLSVDVSYIFIYLEVNLYLVIALSICRPADLPTRRPIIHP